MIVTGANSGVGFAIAQDLAYKGARLYLACRNPQAGEATALKLRTKTGNQAVHFFHLDLKDFDSVRTFVESFLKREKRLDALVNNAAVFHHPPGLTVNQIEITFQTNYLGVFLLTSLLLGVIQQSSNARMIFVSSEAHKSVTPQDLLSFEPHKARPLPTFLDHVKIYGISKLALHVFAQYITQSLPGIYVGLTDPGNVWTPIYRYSWRSWREAYTRVLCYIFMRDPQEGAQSTIHALNAPNLCNGQYINSFLAGEEGQTFDASLVQKLVADSAFLTGLPQSCLS